MLLHCSLWNEGLYTEKRDSLAPTLHALVRWSYFKICNVLTVDSWESEFWAVTEWVKWCSLLPGEPPSPIIFCYFYAYFWSFALGPGLLAAEHRALSKAGSCTVVRDKGWLEPSEPVPPCSLRGVGSLSQIWVSKKAGASPRPFLTAPELLISPSWIWIRLEVAFRYN